MSNNILKQFEAYSLSNKDIFNLLDGKFNLVLYPNIHKYNTIDEVLGIHGACVLLIEARKGYGHWVCLWKLDGNTISFFNSYGGYPDDSLHYVPKEYAKENFEDKPYLSVLLDNSPYNLTYNEYAYQQRGKDVRTCGRHVCVRLFCRTFDDDQYHEYLDTFCKKYDLTSDQFVTLMTMNIPHQEQEIYIQPTYADIIEI